MNNSGTFKPLVSSVCKTAFSWQSALSYYQRSLLECGSSLELEHAQRIALLFLKENGEAQQLSSWAKLFTSEGVPTCSLMLKALVRHDVWRTAVTLWKWNPNDALGEALVDELMSRNLWEQSLDIVNHILSDNTIASGESNINSLTDIKKLENFKDDVALALNDTIRLISDPTFIPMEECKAQSGMTRLANKMFPKKSQWKEAISLLVALSERNISSQTRREILELTVAKFCYDGKQYQEAFNWIRKNEIELNSNSLKRTHLRCAIYLKRFDIAISVLESLHKQNIKEIPILTLYDFCKGFIREINEGRCFELLDRFADIVSKCSSLISSEKIRVELKQFFVQNGLDTTTLDVINLLEQTKGSSLFLGNKVISKDDMGSITNIDRAATLLMSKGDWKASLCLLEKILQTEAVNEKEKVILEAAQASVGNWKTAILFFT
ncbi:uncharacterized protein TM35_000083140 [Trypanosoma theileri]|uniref:Uncharacterized protein n=1 Tax=Trypanosoma theileri TaxID=67003 RepID=A0A1X0P0P1_9TRYP|nr:uncharacterized protein TM35_000083140 [Trypanosoma theileri]ORC90516.1 hypothetical protein TM35_000083140 [Trypanosoma theileri]